MASKVRVSVGHCVKTQDGDPAPTCQRLDCHRRAQYMYRNSAGFKVYRPWCEVHRPIHGITILPDIILRPRPYAAANEVWDEKKKCPFCHRKREPRQPGGVLRPTCREHRGMTPTGERRKQGRPVTTAKKVRVPRPTPRPMARIAKKVAKLVNPLVVTYRDGGKSMSHEFGMKDMARLRILFDRDTGHYPAATDSKLLHGPYPTALIAALWYRWSR